MKLQVVHRTRYQYQSPVKESFNEARLQPMSADGQTCHSFLLKVLPSARLSHSLDFNFNYVHYFELNEPHLTLTVDATALVTTAANTLPENLTPTPMAMLTECARMERCYDFLQASHYVSTSPEVWRLAIDVTAGQTDAWQAALAIMRFVHGNFAYSPLATGVHTHMTEVIEQRRGVCQDFAHVMLGLCRASRIPARYVSGYLYNGPADQLVGAQGSHAWCEVFLPELGWRALDPTNNQQANEHYVKVAVGRDYSDVAPIKGHYKGTSTKTMSVDVSVIAAQG
jgi:transglutaminase-like putative cysteine protease